MVKSYKRRNYFILKDFQGRFILKLLAVSIMGSILAVLVFIFFADRKIDGLLCSMAIPASAFRGNLLLKEALWANVVVASVIAVVFLAAGRAIFRKIIGALSHIRNNILKITGGNLSTKIVLRKNDEFQEFAAEVNNLSTELNRRFSGIKERTKRISEIAKELDKDRITALLEQVDGLRQDVGAFRK